MRLYELAYACRLYATFTDYDSSIERFRRVTSPAVDLENQAHRAALLEWLNSWGCRQFAKDYHPMASDALTNWGGALLRSFTPRSNGTEPAFGCGARCRR